MKQPTNYSLVEEFFLQVSTSQESYEQPILITTSINLNEFDFSEEEIEKLRRLAYRLELSLIAEFSKCFPAASVVVEVRSR